jgi:hypothetical protein
MRLIECGFNSCICPDVLKNKLYDENLLLLEWYPNLDISVEHELHRIFKTPSNGEFYHIDKLKELQHFLSYNGGLKSPRSLNIEYYNKYQEIKKSFIIRDNKGDIWSKDHISKLIRLYKNSIPTSEIARILGRTQSAIISKLSKLN